MPQLDLPDITLVQSPMALEKPSKNATSSEFLPSPISDASNTRNLHSNKDIRIRRSTRSLTGSQAINFPST